MRKSWADFGIDTKGKTSGDIRTTCPQCSPQRKKKTYPCLHVDLDLEVWCCHHCAWAGTIKAGQWERPQLVKQYVKPRFAPAPATSDIDAWFAARGIPADVVARNRITKGVAYFPQVEEERGAILFPYYRGEEVINIKYRTRDKLFRMAAGARRVLYGLNDIDPAYLVVVEGEMDKLAVEAAGILSCVSVPDGAPPPDAKNYAAKFDYLDEPALESVQGFIIAVDNDAPGARLQEELVRRLGRDKCQVVTWPAGCKDANDVLLMHGPAFLAECIGAAQYVPIEDTIKAGDVMDALRSEYQHGSARGVSTGWSSLDDLYRVMPGEWTLVTGVPGHGKSEWLDALTVNLARHEGWTFAIFSPENQPLTYHVGKLAEKYAGKPFTAGVNERMSQDELDDAIAWIDAHYTFLLPKMPTVDALLDKASQLVRREGIRGFILDPWNEIDHTRPVNVTETEHVSAMLTKIRDFARTHGVHAWVVAHPTKLQKEPGKDGKYPVPTPYDVAGSAHWRNKADNCIAVWRDLGKDDESVEIHIQKIRKKANGKVGMATLLYNRLAGQYRDAPAPIEPQHFAKKTRLKAVGGRRNRRDDEYDL